MGFTMSATLAANPRQCRRAIPVVRSGSLTQIDRHSATESGKPAQDSLPGRHELKAKARCKKSFTLKQLST